MSLGPKFIEWFLNYLLLLVGMFPVVAVFCGLVGRWSLGRMCHCGKVVSDGDASGNDALHGCWDSSRCHTHHPRGIPGTGDTERQLCHSRAQCTPITPPPLWRKQQRDSPFLPEPGLVSFQVTRESSELHTDCRVLGKFPPLQHCSLFCAFSQPPEPWGSSSPLENWVRSHLECSLKAQTLVCSPHHPFL